MPKEPLKYVADPRKLCSECGSEMHYCSDEKQSGHNSNGDVYRGCAARNNNFHPSEGDWFICLFCDVSVKAKKRRLTSPI